MKALIGVLVVLILCVAAIGFYRGWFAFSGPNRDTDGNRINVQLSVDPSKVKADTAQAKESASELSGQGKEQP